MWNWSRAKALFAPPKERPTDPQIRDKGWQRLPGLARIKDPSARLGPTRGAHPVTGRMPAEEIRTTSVRLRSLDSQRWPFDIRGAPLRYPSRKTGVWPQAKYAPRRGFICSQNGNRRGWNSANQSPRVTACVPFLTEDVHGIPEERMPIVERIFRRVALDLLSGPIAGPVVIYR
jgi:hypothetical protein